MNEYRSEHYLHKEVLQFVDVLWNDVLSNGYCLFAVMNTAGHPDLVGFWLHTKCMSPEFNSLCVTCCQGSVLFAFPLEVVSTMAERKLLCATFGAILNVTTNCSFGANGGITRNGTHPRVFSITMNKLAFDANFFVGNHTGIDVLWSLFVWIWSMGFLP